MAYDSDFFSAGFRQGKFNHPLRDDVRRGRWLEKIGKQRVGNVWVGGRQHDIGDVWVARDIRFDSQRDRAAIRTMQQKHLILRDQLLHRRNALVAVAAVILDDNFDLPAVKAAFGVYIFVDGCGTIDGLGADIGLAGHRPE